MGGRNFIWIAGALAVALALGAAASRGTRGAASRHSGGESGLQTSVSRSAETSAYSSPSPSASAKAPRLLYKTDVRGVVYAEEDFSGADYGYKPEAAPTHREDGLDLLKAGTGNIRTAAPRSADV